MPRVVATDSARNRGGAGQLIVGPLIAQCAAAGLGTTSVVTGAWRLHARWARRGVSDALTGLPNRKLFANRLEHALVRARRSNCWLGVMAIDGDELASVNNTMGRECGDQLLRAVADKLARLARDADTVARISSDEFAILLEQVDSPTGAARAARRILDAFLQEPMSIDSRAVATSLSIGISLDQGGGASPDSVMREAGIALDRAKARGKRRFEIFEPPMGREAEARLTLEADLKQALARDEMVVHYQPIVDAVNGNVVGAEALVRWIHPDRGLLYPGDFISCAESSGVVVPLGKFVLDAACGAAVRFRSAIGEDTAFRMSVNVSSRQFHDADVLIADVRAALEAHGLPPSALTLEITESSLMDDIEGAIAVVRRLREMGVNVALDDFGTGYSSLSYVKQIPVSGLKIDRSFVSDLEDRTTGAILRAIVGIARELGIVVTAEGAENDEQVGQLRAFGCQLVQGYYYGDAIPPAMFVRMLAANTLPQQRIEPPPAAVRARAEQTERATG
jgi:diguanylate cyclase (GGDEF)-like protein